MSKFVEEVELEGHIIDSLILPKVLDEMLTHGGQYELKKITVGQRQADPSYARIQVRAQNEAQLKEILENIHDHGATPVAPEDCKYVPADMDGVFPDSFYSTTSYRTQVRLQGEWIDVQHQEMDCGILIDPAQKSARTMPMADV